MSYTPTEWESTDVVTATRMNALETAVGDMNMSYTPNTWSDGDILSADKMNALEQAVASGGGGSSDFSTATVTVVNTGSGRSLNGAHALDDGEDTGSVGSMGILASATMTFLVILYKGVAWISAGNTTIVSVSGSAEKLGSSMVMVTGDCTITIS